MKRSSATAPRRVPWLLLAAILASRATPVLSQATNEILDVSPSSAPQGTSGLIVTFTLDTDVPPAPPAGVPPTSVAIGALAGSSATHASQYVVTASFDIPVGEPAGPKDAVVVFPIPSGGTLTFSLPGGFTVTSSQTGPPVVTRDPVSREVCEGSPVTFEVTATGEPPLSWRWQKDGLDIPTATAPSYGIPAVSAGDAGSYRCVVTNGLGTATSGAAILAVTPGPCTPYPVVDTGQAECYGNAGVVACPPAGAPFHGQDSQHAGRQPDFTASADGLTVYDNVTRLTWQHTPDTNGDGVVDAGDKMTWPEAQARPAALNAALHGGFGDWRLPTIKELYSLIDFRGADPSGFTGTDTSGLTPFIDRTWFDFAYGDTGAGERIIDSQYASSTVYVFDPSDSGFTKLFGVNFADGRIKGYDLVMPGGRDKTFLVQCVRGNSSYGANDFADNGDGTVTDSATGLMWAQADSGAAMNWEAALAWVQARNSENYLGHDDWRMPDAKELQSLLDYTRSPDTSGSAAIDPVFGVTSFTNEGGSATDFPWYWASTTHAGFDGGGSFGVYVCFGRCLGWQRLGTDTCYTLRDVHGAGSQRSDPKSGSPAAFYLGAACRGGSAYGNGPQGDVIRVENFVRLVRDAAASPGHAVLRRALAARDLPLAMNLPLEPARDLWGTATASPFRVTGDALPGAGALIFYGIPDASILRARREGGDILLEFVL